MSNVESYTTRTLLVRCIIVLLGAVGLTEAVKMRMWRARIFHTIETFSVCSVRRLCPPLAETGGSDCSLLICMSSSTAERVRKRTVTVSCFLRRCRLLKWTTQNATTMTRMALSTTPSIMLRTPLRVCAGPTISLHNSGLCVIHTDSTDTAYHCLQLQLAGFPNI